MLPTQKKTLTNNVINIFRSQERTSEELEVVFEELLHIAALSHLSTSIKRELASIIVFEAHSKSGTICKSIKFLFFDETTLFNNTNFYRFVSV